MVQRSSHSLTPRWEPNVFLPLSRSWSDNQVREEVISSIKSIPMSDVFETLLAQLRKIDVMSPTVDKFTVTHLNCVYLYIVSLS